MKARDISYFFLTALGLVVFVSMSLLFMNLTFEEIMAFIFLGSILFGFGTLGRSWNETYKGANLVKARLVSTLAVIALIVMSVEWFSFILLSVVIGLPYTELASLWDNAFQISIITIFAWLGSMLYADMIKKEEVKAKKANEL